MNYTDNYHLPQWEKADRVLMDDFNDAMSRLDAGLTGAVSAAAESAGTASAAASKAQSTANSALSAANNAFRPGYLPYKVGTYTGTGNELSIHLGFSPSFVIFSAQETYEVSVHEVGRVTAVAVAGPSGNLSDLVAFTSAGMTVKKPKSSYTYPCINGADQTYSYIAFR